MSEQGSIAAYHHSEELPQFASSDEAEKVLFSLRDATLRAFVDELGTELNLDYSLDSLKRLEKWYFVNGSPTKGKAEFSFAHAIGFYVGELLCRNCGFRWAVHEFVFRPGFFEIGIESPLLSIMLTKGILPDTRDNRRMQSLYRKAKRYWD